MRIVYMGTPEFSVTVLEQLIKHNYNIVGVVTQPDKKVGRKQIITPTPVKRRALEANIQVLQPEKIKTEYQMILDLQPDLIITCAYGQIIPTVLLDRPKLGAINVHASLLPKYRGGAPIQWAMIKGEKETGITIMYMAEAMDAGDIIRKQSLMIDENDTVGTLHERLSELGATLLIETLPSIIDGSNARISQDESLVTYAYNITKEDEHIDFSHSATRVRNHLRALDPWPGAYALIGNERVKLFSASVITGEFIKKIGEIIAIDSESLTVATGNNEAVRIVEAQLPGRKRQALKDILNGKHPFEVGKVLK